MEQILHAGREQYSLLSCLATVWARLPASLGHMPYMIYIYVHNYLYL